MMSQSLFETGECNGFDEFWAAYPLKQAKKDAFKAWCRLSPPPSLVVVILEHLEVRIRSKQWRDGFIPLPGTFIRGERWTDELDPRRDFYRARL